MTVQTVIFSFDTFEVDTAAYEVRSNGIVRPIEPKVFDLLRLLLENNHRPVEMDEVIQRVWSGRSISDATLGSCLNAARRAIGDSGKQQRLIKTLPKRGFRFIGDVEAKPIMLGDAISSNQDHEPWRLDDPWAATRYAAFQE